MDEPDVFPLNLSYNGDEKNLLSDQDCYESEEFVRFQYTVDDLLLAASTASTVFNILVIFCAMKLFKRSGDTMHLFIVNMTLGDLLLTVFCHPNEFLTRKHEFLRHVHLCAVIHFCNWLGLAVSGLSLTLLNVDKLIYFRWPLSYDQTMSKQRAGILCFFIWSVSFGFVSYVWVFQIVYVTSDCMLHMSDTRKYFYEIFMIVFCVMPITSSLFVSIYLFRLTRQKRTAPAIIDGSQVDMPTFKNKLKSLVFIFATTAWTSFSLLPYRIFNLCRIHLIDWNTIGCKEREIMNWVAWILLYLLILNPIVNPLITAIIYAPYRITLKRLLISFPIGNRQAYSSYRGEHTETSFFSTSRHNHHQVNTGRSRNQRPYLVGEEMAEFVNNRQSAASSTASSNKDSIGTFSGVLRGDRGPHRVQSDELGDLMSNGQPRHDIDSLVDEEDDTTEVGSSQSQPTTQTQPKMPELLLTRTGSHRPKSSGSAEL